MAEMQGSALHSSKGRMGPVYINGNQSSTTCMLHGVHIQCSRRDWWFNCVIELITWCVNCTVGYVLYTTYKMCMLVGWFVLYLEFPSPIPIGLSIQWVMYNIAYNSAVVVSFGYWSYVMLSDIQCTYTRHCITGLSYVNVRLQIDR